ncbi:MAG: adenosine kinase [Spirochaetales bacterium]|nr:adenosine kinase [Spirochaetales bacterium]
MLVDKKYSVFGICNPLMDYIVNEDFSFLENHNLKAGTMSLISEKEKDRVLASIKSFKNTPGGSCANTLRGVAFLSQRYPVDQSVYTGVVGTDSIGKKYIHLMEKDFGIKTLIPQKEGATGCSIAIVTPDYERTMLTYLGASGELYENDIDYEVLKQSRYLHIAGYMWGTSNQRKAVMKAVEYARTNHVLVSFDVADPFVVSNNRDEFLKWIPENVDILFGNRDEMVLLTGVDEEEEQIIAEASSMASVVVMKTGAKGCYISKRGEIIFSEGKKVKAIDTVGAGDSFAAGFLYGLTLGRSVKDSAVLANSLAAGIVGVEGCNYTKLNHSEIFDDVNGLETASRPGKTPGQI